jgi:hypothetical protein
VVAANREVFLYSPEGTEDSTKNLRISDVPAEIRTKHLLNKNLECCYFSKLFGRYRVL